MEKKKTESYTWQIFLAEFIGTALLLSSGFIYCDFYVWNRQPDACRCCLISEFEG